MKKKAIFLTAFTMLVCLCATMFSGCLMMLHIGKDIFFDKDKDNENESRRHETLQLGDVLQALDGNLLLDISNTYYIGLKEDRKVEITLNGGKTWQAAVCKYQGFDYPYDYYYEPQREDYGKECNIAVRVAKDGEYLAGKASNYLKYKIKKPSGFDVEDIGGQRDIFMTKTELSAGQYVFSAQDGRLVLNKYVKGENGELKMQPLAENEKDFEYQILDVKRAIEEMEFVRSYMEDHELYYEYFDNLREYYDFLDTAVVTLMYFAMTSEDFLDYKDVVYHEEWKDYDRNNGISKDVYQKGIISDFKIGFDEDKDITDITRVGSMVCVLIRTKGDSMTLESKCAVAFVELNE